MFPSRKEAALIVLNRKMEASYFFAKKYKGRSSADLVANGYIHIDRFCGRCMIVLNICGEELRDDE